jgi:hypothetical protein
VTVAELRKALETKPDSMLICFDDGENGRTDVSKVCEEADYHHAELMVLVIGRKLQAR